MDAPELEDSAFCFDEGVAKKSLLNNRTTRSPHTLRTLKLVQYGDRGMLLSLFTLVWKRTWNFHSWH